MQTWSWGLRTLRLLRLAPEGEGKPLKQLRALFVIPGPGRIRTTRQVPLHWPQSHGEGRTAWEGLLVVLART